MTPGFVIRLAARETRAAWRRLLVLTAAVTVGTGALVAINSFSDNLRSSVRDQARALLGADLSLESRRPFAAHAAAVLDTLARDGRVARTVNFAGMAYVPRTTGTRLVQVTAVDGGFPFYGEIGTEPAAAWRELQRGPHVVVEPALLTQLDARVGDTLALGEGRFVITGTVTSIPGNVGVRAAFGARVFIPASELEATKLLAFGSRAEYSAFVQLPAGRDAQALAKQYRPRLRADRVRIRSVEEDRDNLSETLGRLTDYLGLVALIALLLGGLGVASAVTVFIRRKLDAIAALRCIGATSRQVFSAYLLQSAAMGFLGSVIGVLLGLVIQRLLPGVLKEFLPVTVTPSLSWRAIALGLGTGLWVSIVFALLPLLGVRRVSPLAAIRRDYEPARGRDPLVLPVLVLLAASVVGLATLQVGNWRTALAFTGGIGGALLVLWLASWALARAVRRWTPARWPYVWRQGLANLHRPANQTVTVVLSLGFGAFLLTTLFLVQHNLLRQISLGGGAMRPNLVFFDIQPDQQQPLAALLAEQGIEAGAPVPIVPMRINAINGRPVLRVVGDTAEWATDSAAPGDRRSSGWALRREYRSTYRDSLVASEKLVAGKWWEAKQTEGPGAISVEVGLASELNVTIGDTITWDVQGVPLTTVVRSIREVDWARFDTNFFVVFEPGLLDRAPQSFVMLGRVDDPALRGRVQRAVVERFGNVTTVDLATLQGAVEKLVNQVTLAIRFMAVFSLLTGALVLVGAVATSRFQRIREGALLRTLGATRRQVLRVVLAEYLALGSLAALVGVGLAIGASWAIAKWVFEGPFGVPGPAVAFLALAITLGTALLGALNSREVLRLPPLEVLRGE
ncbi:MAG TPA: FtsX-like permease family protein [Gemmatimonadales bacterium]|nr:FtsX-like permease family protein [Gemmatimonadales bacterium]